MCGPRKMDKVKFGKAIMKLGLALIVIGHLNFIVGAIVHGLVLRHVSKLQDIVSLQYSISNIITVASAILSISCGIAAIVLSRYLTRLSLRWTVLVLSIINAILSFTCAMGLAVSIIITVANKGRTLLSTCSFTNLELIQISHECPFDPTRIYGTTLCLWVISLFLDTVEVVFSMRSFVTILRLMDVRFCRKRKAIVRFPQQEEIVNIEREDVNEDGEYSAWL
ncbi:transmembrane protein 54 [Discoglossus pictus]